jgi:hypothetical protein
MINMASKEDTKKKETSTSNAGLWIGISVAVLVIIGAIVFFFWKKRGTAPNSVGNLYGTPTPGGNAAVPAMPSMTSGISAGNATGANAGLSRNGPPLR